MRDASGYWILISDSSGVFCDSVFVPAGDPFSFDAAEYMRTNAFFPDTYELLIYACGDNREYYHSDDVGGLWMDFPADPAAKLSGVTLNATGTVQIGPGEVLRLAPSLKPFGAQAVIAWKTSSKKLATVTNGYVKALKEGTVTITVTAKQGKLTKTAKVKVKIVDPRKPSRVVLDHTGTVTLPLGETLTLTQTLMPAGAEAVLSWKTSSKKIAAVSDGVVTPLKEGTATITVTAKRGSVTKTAKVKVKVIDPLKPTKVVISAGAKTMKAGESLPLTATVLPDTAAATSPVTWKVSNSRLASIDGNGLLTAKKAGTVRVTATATCGTGRKAVKKTATFSVKITK